MSSRRAWPCEGAPHPVAPVTWGSEHGAAEADTTSHPAPAGSIVDLFGTGFGTVPGSVALGDFFPESDQPDIARSVSAQIGGRDAEVISASGAPGAFSGIYRIRLRVPEELAPGEHAVTVSVADSSASNHVTIRIGE